jgi:acetolactate decarboxylase
MVTRRRLLHTAIASCCAACAALARTRLSNAGAVETPNKISGRGYELCFVGGQRQTIMSGDRAARIDLRSLQRRPHLYGIGPTEGLTGEVTIADCRPSLARVGADGAVHVSESYEAGAPFFVWAEVAAWQIHNVPVALHSYEAVEKFVGEAGAKAGLTQAFPFVMTGRPDLIDFHVLNAKPDTPPGMEAHKKIQIPFELHQRDVTFVGFWSNAHQGIFTPMGQNMHVHFQTRENDLSGHVQGLELPQRFALALPKGE